MKTSLWLSTIGLSTIGALFLCFATMPASATQRSARRAEPSTTGSAVPGPGAPAQPFPRMQRSDVSTANTGTRDMAAAQRNCFGDQVVWANPDSHVYHVSGSRFYGSTKAGTYMCRSAADRSGFRAAKNEHAR